MADPRVLLIDEPSVGLSPISRESDVPELRRFAVEGRTILLVDQDVRAAINVADYVYVLNSGKNDIEGDRSAFEGDLGHDGAAMARGLIHMRQKGRSQSCVTTSLQIVVDGVLLGYDLCRYRHWA